jgi:hypothetical protein
MPGVIDAGLQRTLVDLAPELALHAGVAGFGDAAVALAHDQLLDALLAGPSWRNGAASAMPECL